MTPHSKPCPTCGKDLFYIRKEDLTASLKKGARCKSCANTGSNHPSFGKKLSEERCKAISTRMKGANHPNYGRKMPEEHRKIISSANKGKIPATAAIRRGKTLEEIYGKDRAEKIKQKYRERKQTPESNAKRRESCIKAGCGQANIGRKASDETKALMRKSFIARLKRTHKDFHPPYNIKGCAYFDRLMVETGTHIQHALNGGEHHLEELGVWLDGYDAINNIVYEYDELRHHYKNGELTQKDIDRQIRIEEHLKCTFVRIKETDVPPDAK